MGRACRLYGEETDAFTLLMGKMLGKQPLG
jgi:hypothetical protein